jgi:hypothetical protein
VGAKVTATAAGFFGGEEGGDVGGEEGGDVGGEVGGEVGGGVVPPPPGTLGVTWLDALENGPVPLTLIAATLKV